jgi:hypothetical protein
LGLGQHPDPGLRKDNLNIVGIVFDVLLLSLIVVIGKKGFSRYCFWCYIPTNLEYYMKGTKAI